MSVLKVMSPKGTDLVLATHVPHGEADVLVFHCLHVEAWTRRHSTWSWGVRQMLIATRTGWVLLLSSRTDCGDGGDDLPQLQLVEDGSLPGGVQAHHEDPHFFFAYQALQQVPKDVSHDDSDLSCNRTVRQVTEQQSGCKYSHEGKKKKNEKSIFYQHYSPNVSRLSPQWLLQIGTSPPMTLSGCRPVGLAGGCLKEEPFSLQPFQACSIFF